MNRSENFGSLCSALRGRQFRRLRFHMIQRGKDNSGAGGAQRSTPHMTQPNIQGQPQPECCADLIPLRIEALWGARSCKRCRWELCLRHIVAPRSS